MAPTNYGVAALAVVLFYVASSSYAKPLTQSMELSAADRVHYFGHAEVQDFELVSPQVSKRRRHATQGNHIEAKKVVFEAFDERFDIALEPKVGLVDAGTLVHEVGKDGKTVLSQPKEYCLYVGKSLDHKDSTVSASDCGNKLQASIATDKAAFQLQPLKTEHKEKDGPTHMVVRRSVNTQACNMDAERSLESTMSRRKRSTAEPIYVDASVVADDLMYKTYGNETNNYLLTILNQVAGLLKDPSLDVQVNLKISNIKIVKTPQLDLSLSEDLEKSLGSFCSWQKKSDSDISILITRRDLVSGGNHKVTGKAADVGGACDPKRRCLIGQDHGPSGLIFTLAHEIGHSLGMYHDGGLSDCANKKNIMASVNSGGPEAFRWSECSNNDLLNFLARPESKCLKDKSKSRPDYTPSSIPMPGFYFNATEQCAMTYNAKSTVASEVLNKKEICTALVCKNGNGIPESTNVPPLDGTRCGTKRDICIHGECLKVYSTMDCEGGPCIPFWLAGSYTCQNSTTCVATRSVLCVEEHDDGTTRRVLDLSRCPIEVPTDTGICPDDPCRFAFITGEYGTCSVTCGTGVQVRNVVCQDRSQEIPTIVNDALCQEAKPLTTQVCVLPACPVNSYSYAVGQFQECSVTCGSGVQLRSVTCQDNVGEAVAEVFCIQLGLFKPSTTQNCDTGISCGLRYVAGPYATCSVTCGSGTRTRMIYCVNGNNLVVALARCEDAQLASPSLTTTCEQEACPSPVYTALRGTWSECSVTCGLGTETRFVACRNNNVDVDVQNCIDAGLTDLETLRVCTRPTCQPEYRFEAGAFSDCSVTCGTGLRTRDVQCLDQDNVAVAIDNCLTIGLTPPPSTMECTLEDCPTYIYQVGEFGACTEECGDGLQLRAVVCVNNDTKAVVDDANCPGERPASTQPCNLMPCNTLLQFVTSPFSACNCSGLQTRIVICIQRVGTVLEQVSTQNCLDAGLEALPTTQDCPPPADCVQPNPVWQTTEWSTCPVTCGVGTQTRLVYCIAQPGSTDIVDDSECVAGDKPPTTQECDTEVVCPTAYLWLTYGWGACSVTCGEGFESRDVFCFSLGTNIVQVDDSLCNAGEKPNTVRPCSLTPCTASWTTSDWTECSVTCGPGTQTRTVACQQTKDPNSNIVDESECIAEARPSEARPCYLALCPAPFGCETSYMLEGTVQYTESSPGFTDGQNYPNDLECSKAFVADNNIQDGRRRRRRNVQEPQYCIQLTFTAFDVEPSTDCTVDYLEISDIRYNTSERLCGNSYELPLVWESVGPHVNLYFHTDATVTRPGYSVIYNAVEKQEPAGYEVTEWSACSVTCGEGVETREVLCVRGNETVDNIECSGLQKPVSSQPCVEDECIEPSVCSGDLLRTENNAIILSPDFPSAYPNNISCSNVIRAPEGMIMEIFVTFFNLRPEECSDRVLIKDVNVDGEPLELCGNQAPGIVFTSITNEVTVQFESAETGSISPTGFGFSLRADFMNQPPVSCGNQISESGRAVYSPNYPGDYNLNENCLTVIRNDEGCIKLRFLDIDLPPQNGQCSDFVQLVDLNEIAVNTGPLCGREIPTVFYSFTGLMTVRFFSDENGPTDGGFNAVVNFVDCYEGVWLTGPFEECSATCGEAVRRRTVSCQNPQTDALVDPTMCPPEIPDEEIPCDVPQCPSCDVTVTESGEIGSPNSPSNYDNNQRCETEIVNPDGCVAINFLAFDLQPGLGGECDTDFLEITDVAREEPIKLCGSTLPDTYQSLGGTVQLLFQTDESVVSTGYYAYVSFIPCPVNAYIVGNWSECSVTCGAGVRTRDVQCMDLINNVPVEDSVCQGERPPSEEPCMADEECPSCDVTITESLMFVTSPDFPNPYAPNLECVYTFNSPDPEQCVRLTIIEAYLNGADDNDLCSRDYLEITSQSGQPALRFCPESARSIPWYSRDNTASVRFVTDEEGASSGFNMYVVFGSCPTYDFVVGDYSECSARCGGGVRTRVVSCISLSDGSGAPDELCPNQRPLDSIPCNTEPCPVCDAAFFPGDELIMSPDFSSAPGQGYERSLDCTYNITNPDGCLFLTFLSFELQECADCSCDYLSITEDNAEALPPLCGTQNDRTWASTTGNVMLNFVTDNSISAAGFNIYVAYVDCPDVYYFTGDYSECDVSCGGGTQTRLVQCRSRTTGMEVDESMCTGVKPPTERPCGEDPCPFCDEVITTPSFIASPEYPDNYPVSINCNYAIQAPAGRCVSINVLAFELQEAEGDPMMCQDYIEIRDQGAPTLDRRYCGLAAPNAIQWRSRFGSVSLDFSSDEEDTSSGFRAYVNFVDCPQYGYVATEFSMCSRPCGGGTQTREVSCINLATQQPADEVNCEDERPSESIPCNLQDCPECDEQITENRQSVYSLNFPQPYFEYSCNYIYTNPGGCVELLFVQFEMPIPNAEDVCDKDYLLVEDMSDRPFSYRICGPDIPNAVVSRGERLNVTLVTDGNPSTFGEGYQLYNLFTNNCPEVGYVASEFGECDRQCGFGTRTREVNCVDLQSGITVDESLCTDVEPSSTEFCNTQPCPSCDQVVDTFPIALNSPADLDPLRTCQYDIESERCIRATFLTFDFPGENGMCADTFVQLQDEGAEFLTERFCGDGPGAASGAALYAWESRTSDVLMTLNSGTDLTADNRFRIFLTEMDCPEFGFVAGEFDECSRSCGEGGVQTRTVECQRLADNSPVEEGLCTDPKPSETRPCAPQPPCPSCDMFVSDPETLVQGPPRNSNWTTDVRCRITVEYDTSCVVISGLQVMLSEPDENGTCVDSSLTFFDGTYPAYTETVCGSSSGGVYRALTRRYVVDFYSADYENSGDSFNLFVQAAACPMIEYQTSEFSQCSASCGGGIRTRDVTCVRADSMEEVPDDACSGPRPTAIEGCNLEACPKECDNVITVNTPVQLLTSPGRPTYVTDADCTNNIINLSGCIVLAFLSVDIEEGTMPGVCDKDYLEIIDATFDELSVRLCGNTLPSTAWRSQSGSIRTRFVSDSVDTQQAGYTLTYTLTPTCPTGSYVLSGFDDCSATCGEGTRTAADLNCVLPDSSIGTNSDCPGLPPSRVESCNLGECPEFYFFTGEYSNCSVECGDGTQTRVVECRRLDNDTVVDDGMCTEVKPETSMACNLMACVDNAFVLSETPQTETVQLGESGTIQSPNYPNAYPNNLNAQVVLTIPANTLLRVTIDTLDLVFESPCANGDFLRFSSGSNTVLQVCQTTQLPFDWFSGAGDTEVTIAMTTSATNAGTGFMGRWTVIVPP